MTNATPLFEYENGIYADNTPPFLARRRAVLKALLAGVGLGFARAGLATGPADTSGQQTTAAPHTADTPAWDTMAAVQDQLLPSEPEAPGASDVNALGYLRDTIYRFDADPAERKFLLAGLKWMDGSARQTEGLAFASLPEVKREELMNDMASSKDGENWLSLTLYYVMEALLTDPVYGGNTDAAGWKWLHYIPGFPRPPVGKRYYELMGR